METRMRASQLEVRGNRLESSAWADHASMPSSSSPTDPMNVAVKLIHGACEIEVHNLSTLQHMASRGSHQVPTPHRSALLVSPTPCVCPPDVLVLSRYLQHSSLLRPHRLALLVQNTVAPIYYYLLEKLFHYLNLLATTALKSSRSCGTSILYS